MSEDKVEYWVLRQGKSRWFFETLKEARDYADMLMSLYNPEPVSLAHVTGKPEWLGER